MNEAAFSLEEALGTIHLVKGSKLVRAAAERLVKDVAQMLGVYPDLKKIICGD